MNRALWSFACRKLLSCITSLWIIVTLTFFLMKAVPGDPLTQEQALHPEVYKSLRSYYGLDRPLLEQYLTYLQNVLSFNMGPSLIHHGRTASQVILESFPISGLLGAEALLLALAFGLSVGTLSALNVGGKLDRAILAGSVVFLSIPSFILAASLQYIVGAYCNWLPIAQWDSFSHTVLPAVALAAMPAAFLAKLVRANMVEILQLDYILLAHAKGLPFRTVLFKHALRNAALPLFGFFGKMSANILVGSFIIEKIFCIPGLGYWFVSCISNRDYPMIMGLTIFYSLVLLGALFLADLAHALMDSRLYRNQERVVT